MWVGETRFTPDRSRLRAVARMGEPAETECGSAPAQGRGGCCRGPGFLVGVMKMSPRGLCGGHTALPAHRRPWSCAISASVTPRGGGPRTSKDSRFSLQIPGGTLSPWLLRPVPPHPGSTSSLPLARCPRCLAGSPLSCHPSSRGQPSPALSDDISLPRAPPSWSFARTRTGLSGSTGPPRQLSGCSGVCRLPSQMARLPEQGLGALSPGTLGCLPESWACGGCSAHG